MKITENQLNQLFSQNWTISNGSLKKIFKFNSYEELVIFANKIFEVAQKLNHHPELLLKYNVAEVSISNHDEKNISSKCNDFALELDLINFSHSIK